MDPSTATTSADPQVVGSSGTSSLAAQLALRASLRAANKKLVPGTRPLLSNHKLDLKKAGIFAKRFRNYTVDSERLLATDLETYNVKMCITEAAQNVCLFLFETTKALRTAEIISLVISCCHVHQRYDSFFSEVLAGIKKQFDMAPFVSEMTAKFDPAAPTADSAKLRSIIRFMAECFLYGLLDDAKFLIGVLAKFHATLNANPAHHVTYNSLTIASLIVRSSLVELLGPTATATSTPTKYMFQEQGALRVAVEDSVYQQAVEALEARKADPAVVALSYGTPVERTQLVEQAKGMFLHGVGFIGKLTKAVEQKWKQMCEQAELRGDPTAEAKETFEVVRREAVRLYVALEALSAALGVSQDMPPAMNLTKGPKVNNDGTLTFTGRLAEMFQVKSAETLNQYDDDEQRAFYEEYPIFDDVVLQSVLEKVGKGFPELKGPMRSEAENEEALDAVTQGSTKATQVLQGLEKKPGLDYKAVEELLETQHRCCSTVTIDEWTASFLAESCRYLNEVGGASPSATSSTRTQNAAQFFLNCKLALLVSLRFEAAAQDVVPFLARCAASFHARVPDFGDVLGRQLENYLQYTIRNSKQNRLQSKLINTRYLCELTKFRVIPPIRLIRVMHLFLDHFDDQHCVRLAIMVLEQAMAFLMRGAVTKPKAEELIQKFREKEKRFGVTTEMESVLENAWSDLRRVLRPSGQRRPQLTRAPSVLEEYVYALMAEGGTKVLGYLQELPYGSNEPLPPPPGSTATTAAPQPATAAPSVGGESSSNLGPSTDAPEASSPAPAPANGSTSSASPPPTTTAASPSLTVGDALISIFRHCDVFGIDRLSLVVTAIEDATALYGGSVLLDPILEWIFDDMRQDLEQRVVAGGGGTATRSLQKRLFDVEFLAQLLQARLLSSSFAWQFLAMLLAYFPSPVPITDCSRVRLVAHMFLRTAQELFEDHADSLFLRQRLEIAMSRFCLHLHRCVKPLPMDLDYSIQEAMEALYGSFGEAPPTADKEEEKETEETKDGTATATNTKKVFRRLPRTMKEAVAYRAAVDAEPQHPENAAIAAALEAYARASITAPTDNNNNSNQSSRGSASMAQQVYPVLSAVGANALQMLREQSSYEDDGSDEEGDDDEDYSSSEDRSSATSSDEEDYDDEEEESGSEGSSSSSYSSEDDDSDCSSSSSDDEEEEEEEGGDSSALMVPKSDQEEFRSRAAPFRPTLGPMANAHHRQQPTTAQRTADLVDEEFDRCLRQAYENSGAEAVRRMQSRPNVDKAIETKLAAATVAKAAATVVVAPTAVAMLNAATNATAAAEPPSSSSQGRAAVSSTSNKPVGGTAFVVLRRNMTEARQVFIPSDSEFALKATSNVAAHHAEVAQLQNQVKMIARAQDNEELAAVRKTLLRK